MRKTVIVLAFAALLVAGCGMRAKSGRTVELAAAITAGQEFRVWSENDDIRIKVTPGDAGECKVKAIIAAQAFTQGGADGLARKAEVTLEEKSDAVVVDVAAGSGSVAVELYVTLPKGTKVDLAGTNGYIAAATIDGPLTADSENGAIILRNCSGKIHATAQNGTVTIDYTENSPRSPEIAVRAQNGSIACREVAGDLDLESQNGRIEASYWKGAGASPTVKIDAQNGSISFASPPQIDAKLDISTGNGTIAGSLPGKLQGKISNQEIQGTIGEGKGSITLQTENGAIRLK